MTAGPSLSRRERALILGEASADAVAPLSGVGVPLYLLFAVSHMLILPVEQWRWLTPLAFITALVMALIYVPARRGFSPRAAPWVLFALFLLGLLNSATHLIVQHHPRQTTNFMLMFVIGGMLLLFRRAYLALVVIGFAVWVPVAWAWPREAEWMHMGFAMITSATAGGVAVTFRQRAVLRLALSQRALREHQTALSAALTEARVELAARRRAEDELRILKDELEERVKLRTAELVESHRRLRAEMDERMAAEARVRAQAEQLQKAQRLEMVGLLAGGIAHDFNNVLTIIMASAELAARKLNHQAPTARPYLEEIVAASERASTLTRQLLAFGRKQVMSPRPLNLNDVLTRLKPLLVRLVGERIELALELMPELPTAELDLVQLEQVFANLVLNARDAMPSGGKLTISTLIATLEAGERLELAPGEYVLCSVRDTGQGMTDEVKRRIFEPFFSTKGAQGTGLGLASVHGIIKQSHGDIEVESAPNQGTTFRLWFPAAKSAPEPIETSSIRPAVAANHGSILLAEDNDSLRELLVQALEDAGFQVVAAPDGRAALVALERCDKPIDLLLSDVVMPELDGRALADAVSKRQPGVPVLFMSAYAPDTMGRLTLGPGEALLRKPFGVNALVQRVRELLAARANLRANLH